MRSKNTHPTFKEEKSCLLPLQQDFVYIEQDRRIVKNTAFIQFKNNFYSVPTDYVGKKVDVNYSDTIIHCIYQGQIIASHTRLHGKSEYGLSLIRHLDLFHKKPGGFKHSLLFHQLPKIIQKTYINYFHEDTKEFINFVQNHLEGNNQMMGEILKNKLSKIKRKITKEKILALFERK
ncbi:Mu transposase domain-containing protein [Oceanobacillus halotolerans]|uniref:Mu transposase domain-containing protein n=1 Tax=Oceanobacillus halotolerans TaxID=2663380 RepID=UPI0038501270